MDRRLKTATPIRAGFLLTFLEWLGARVTGAVASVLIGLGETAALFFKVIWNLPLVLKNPGLLMQQMVRMGVSSLPLVMVVSVFIGAVTAIQAHYQFRGLVPDTYLGTAVGKFVIIESGPVLTALVLAGRIGSAIAAEVGSMNEKEELDAMKVLDLDPLRYLALPRVLAGILVFPLLVVLADFLALIGGWAVARWNLDITTVTYIHGLRFLFDPYDVWVGFIKAFSFGVVVSFTGYYQGLHAGAGAKGVGHATMRSVVTSCVLILVLDFFIVYLVY